LEETTMARTYGNTPARTAKQVQQALVRKQALELRIGGATYDQIAIRLGYSGATAAQRAIDRELKAIPRLAAEQLRDLEAERMDAMHLALWRRALRGDAPAVAQVLDIMKTRAKMFGLNIEAEGTPTVNVEKAYIGIDLEKL
jgi:hypothetical protein